MPACYNPQATYSTRCRRTQRSQLPRLSLHSQSVHSEANDSLRLAHSSPPQLKLCTLATLGSHRTEFTNSSTPKPKVHRMWYDCFRPKPNVRRTCQSVHIRRRNRNRTEIRSTSITSHQRTLQTDRQTDGQTDDMRSHD